MKKLATIGYEGSSQKAVLETLKEAGIDLLVDVRAVVSSRKPGFSKNQLASALDGIGIDYVHLRDLGTPKEGRDASHARDWTAFNRIYAAQMRTGGAKHDYETLLEMMKTGKKICLMCFEHDPAHCHRAILAERVHDDLGARIAHLMPETAD